MQYNLYIVKTLGFEYNIYEHMFHFNYKVIVMKVLMRPIEMIAWFTKDGVPHPLRYRMEERDEKTVIKVDQVLATKEEKFAGNRMLIFDCQSEVNGQLKRFELKYELSTCKWFLYKI